MHFPGYRSPKHYRGQWIASDLEKTRAKHGLAAAVSAARGYLNATPEELAELALSPEACVIGLTYFLHRLVFSKQKSMTEFIAALSMNEAVPALTRDIFSYCHKHDEGKKGSHLTYQFLRSLMHRKKHVSDRDDYSNTPPLFDIAERSVPMAMKVIDVVFESCQHHPEMRNRCINNALSLFMRASEKDFEGFYGPLAHHLLGNIVKASGTSLLGVVGNDGKGLPIFILDPEHPRAPTAFARPVVTNGQIEWVEFIGGTFRRCSIDLAQWSLKHHKFGGRAFTHTLDLISAADRFFFRQHQSIGQLKKNLKPLDVVVADRLRTKISKEVVPYRPCGTHRRNAKDHLSTGCPTLDLLKKHYG